MGRMTVISILNDAWETIKANPTQFIKNIEKGMNNSESAVQSYPVENYNNPMEVHRSFQSNLNHVMVVGRNHMEDLTDLTQRKMTDDFYLAYKMQTIHCAEDMAKSVKMEIIEAAAEMIAEKMKNLRKSFDDIQSVVEQSDIYEAMNEDERTRLIKLIGCKLQNN
jgi:fibronectin type 3 domain-containing protein